MNYQTAMSRVEGLWTQFLERWEDDSKFRSAVLTGGIAVCVMTMLILALQLVDTTPHKQYFDPDRDYSRIPFDELDAHNICQQETSRRYGNAYLRGYVDQHSSRHDASKGLFKIFMFADIGTLKNYEQAAVHCFVDPDEYVVDHYRTYWPKKGSLLDRAKGFFGID